MHKSNHIAAQKPSIPKGTRDFSPIEMVRRNYIFLLAFEGDSKVVWFEGNYSDYEKDRKARLGPKAEQPHRIKYRQLTR